MTGDATLSDDLGRRQRVKNIALLVALAAFAILFYFISMVKFGAGLP